MNDSEFPQNTSLLQHYEELLGYISMKIGNRQMALDVVQETYLRVLQRPEQFLNLINPSAFLKKVSMNIALDHLRKDKNNSTYFEFIDANEIEGIMDLNIHFKAISEQELYVAKTQFAQLILKQIEALSPVCQDVFLLIQFHGMTQVEASQQLGISRTMVIKHFTRALKKFMPIFNDDNHEYGNQQASTN